MVSSDVCLKLFYSLLLSDIRIRFHRADESKVHELSLQLEKYQKELIHKRELLEREITETQAAQIELDKTAEDFKELHAERQRLLEQWYVLVDHRFSVFGIFHSPHLFTTEARIIFFHVFIFFFA